MPFLLTAITKLDSAITTAELKGISPFMVKIKNQLCSVYMQCLRSTHFDETLSKPETSQLIDRIE